MQLYREIGGGGWAFSLMLVSEPLPTRVTAAASMDRSAKDDLVEVIEIGGKELLWYKSFPINVTIIRGSFGDADGNISLDQEDGER